MVGSTKMALLTQIVMVLVTVCTAASYVPNIIIITADDIGFNDLGFNKDSQVRSYTPELDRYARSSTILKNYFVMPHGYSTRSALLTGKHPATLGTQFDNADKTSQFGLDLNADLLPKLLKKLEYKTHAVGQWDLGFYTDEYLPTSRGFDTFFGQYLSYGNYTTHKFADESGDEGFDLHDDTKSSQNRKCINKVEETEKVNPTFKPEMYTKRAENVIDKHDTKKPLFLYVAFQAAQIRDKDVKELCEGKGQIPNDYIRDIREGDSLRRCYLALLKAVDLGYARIMRKLQERMMLANSIVIFTTTSGGPAADPGYNSASNAPYRGSKGTGWEGGVRGSGFVYNMMNKDVRESSCLFHVTDWVPTILSMYNQCASEDISLQTMIDERIYGIDQIECLYRGGSSQRDTIIHFLYGQSASIITDGYKLVMDYSKHMRLSDTDEWYSEQSDTYVCKSAGAECHPYDSPCLFDINNDPCEKDNLAATRDVLLEDIKEKLRLFNKTVKYSVQHASYMASDLKTQEGCWAPLIGGTYSNTHMGPSITLLLTICCIVLYSVFIS